MTADVYRDAAMRARLGAEEVNSRRREEFLSCQLDKKTEQGQF